MRVGVVCPYDLGLPGGVQQQCIELADRLRAAGDEVILTGPGSGSGWESLGGSVTISANASKVPIALAPAVTRRLREIVDGVDLLHVHEPLIPLVGWAALRIRKPAVLTFHADPPGWARASYRRLPPPRSIRSRTLTAVSEVAASAVPEQWGSVEIIPNAIDVASYRPDVERVPHRVAFLGRDDPRKGLDTVLRAWTAVRAAHPQAELVVIGARRDEVVQGVRFAGRVGEDEKRSLLASSSIYVAPNLGGESFGIVVAEAMAAGCLPVVSDIPAFRAVAGSAARYLVPAEVGAWAGALIELLSDPDAMSVGRAAASTAAERYDWTAVVGRYRDAYRRAVAVGAG